MSTTFEIIKFQKPTMKAVLPLTCKHCGIGGKTIFTGWIKER